jgi:hypothetical protein
LVRSDRILSLGLESASYAWWRGALTGILAGAVFALTLAAALPRSSAVPQTSPAPVKLITNEIPSSAPALEGIAKKEVLVLPPAYSATEPSASEPIAPSVAERSSSAMEQSSVDDWDFQNCVGCSVPADVGAEQDASRSSDTQAQAPDAAQPDEIVQPPVVIVEPPPVAYFAVGAPAAFSVHPASPANAPPPGGLGRINPGFLGTIHAPAFGGGMPVNR